MKTATIGTITSAHVTLQAPDFDASLKFYTQVMGFNTKSPVFDAPTGRWVEIEAPGVTIGLHEAKEMESSGPLPQHSPMLGFHVNDLDAVKEQLESKKVRFAPQEVSCGSIRFAFFSDPAGNPCYIAQIKI